MHIRKRPQYNVISNLRKNADYIKFLTLSTNHIGLDMDELLDALKNNHTLVQVSCHSKFMAHLTAEQISHLLESVSKLPKMQELIVSLPPNRTALSGHVVDCVEHAKGVSKLKLTGFDDDACLALATCLRTHPSLTEVHLTEGSQTEKPLGPRAMARTLHTNTRLIKLTLSCAQLENADVRAMTEALAHNTTLQKLDLRCTTRGDEHLVDYTPLVTVLQEDNETLRSLQTDAPASIQSEIDFYTQLNASGAPKLLKDPDADDQSWLDQISQHSKSVTADGEIIDGDDLSVLFYTLSQEPKFLLSYDFTMDKHANKRPTCLMIRNDSIRSLQKQPGRRGIMEKLPSTRSLQVGSHNNLYSRTTLNPKRRKKAARAPACWELNIPW